MIVVVLVHCSLGEACSGGVCSSVMFVLVMVFLVEWATFVVCWWFVNGEVASIDRSRGGNGILLYFSEVRVFSRCDCLR